MNAEIFIGIKRIIAVDSAEFSYAELDIDEHSILLAEGNVGKSSLVNAIRLFLLPECSMSNQKDVFGFASSKGNYYRSQSTFKHYFPSKYSFLILEYDKTLLGQPHCCQILSSANSRLKFERMFTNLPFEQLRHLFWDAKDDPDNIGRRVDDLSKDKVYEFIREHDKHSVLVKDSQKCAELLYESDLFKADFTLFPLKDVESHSIESLRSVIKLLLMGKADDKNFIKAIANIIEAKKKDKNSELGFNISQFKERHEDLAKQEAMVTLISNMRKEYEICEKNRASWLSHLDSFKGFFASIKYLDERKITLSKVKDEQAKICIETREQYTRAKATRTQYEDQYRDRNNLRQNAIKEIKQYTEQLSLVAKIKLEFLHNYQLEDIKDILEDERANAETALRRLKGESEAADEIEQLRGRITAAEERLASLEKSKNKQEFLLQQQLPESAVEVLAAINQDLIVANPLHALSDKECKAIIDFTSLFECKEQFHFYDKGFNKVPVRAFDYDGLIESCEMELQSNQKMLAQLTKEYSNPLNKQKDIEKLTKEIAQFTKDIAALSEADYAEKRLAQLEQDKTLYDEQILATAKKLEEAQAVCVEAEQINQSAVEQRNGIDTEIQEIVTLQRQFNIHKAEYASWLEYIDKEAIEAADSVSEQDLFVFTNNANKLKDYLYQLRDALRLFVDAYIVEDKHNVKGEPTWKELAATLDELSIIYGNLATRKMALQKQIQEHNKTIATKKKILSYNYKMIRAFEKEINQAFEQITINNIDTIEYKVGVNPLFEALVKDIETETLFTGEMISEDFYQKLMAFAEKFFTKTDTFTLTMDKVVESLVPKVKLSHKATASDAEQSNSTTSLINIKLVQLLLKRLIAVHCQTAYPIVFDEAANVDVSQFKWWLKDLKDHGFNLLTAGTHSTGAEVIDIIGRHHILDALRSSHPYSTERNRVFWNGAEKFYSTVELPKLMSQDEQEEWI